MISWSTVVLGWPAAGVGLLLGAFAIAKRSPKIMLASAIFLTPFGLYISGYPIYHVWGPIALLLYFFAPWALHRGSPNLAVVLAMPEGLVALDLARRVLARP